MASTFRSRLKNTTANKSGIVCCAGTAPMSVNMVVCGGQWKCSGPGIYWCHNSSERYPINIAHQRDIYWDFQTLVEVKVEIYQSIVIIICFYWIFLFSGHLYVSWVFRSRHLSSFHWWIYLLTFIIYVVSGNSCLRRVLVSNSGMFSVW